MLAGMKNSNGLGVHVNLFPLAFTVELNLCGIIEHYVESLQENTVLIDVNYLLVLELQKKADGVSNGLHIIF